MAAESPNFKIRLADLVDSSRGFPQIGHRNPADDVRRSVISAEAGRAKREEILVQSPETVQSETVQSVRGIIRRIFGR